jgi:hypothetical protein
MAKKTTSTRTIAKRHEDNDVDGCDVQLREGDATPDYELPPAKGGVEIFKAPGGPSRAKRGRRVRR